MEQTLVYDTETNQYQSVPSDQAFKLLQNPSFHVPMNDPEGYPVTVPYSDALNLMKQNMGYTQPTAQQLQILLDSSLYSTPEQNIKAFGDSISRGLLPFDVGTQAQVALGESPEEMRKRRLYSSGLAQFAGEALGLSASSLLPGVGQANVMEAAGLGGLKLLGLGTKAGETLSLGQKITRGTIKEALEWGLLGSGEAINQLTLRDPEATAENAWAGAGETILSSVLMGGAFGALTGPFRKFAPKQAESLEKSLRLIQEDSNPDLLGPAAPPPAAPGTTEGLSMSNWLKRFINIGLGPSVESQEEYLKKSELINSELRSEFKDVYEFVLGHVQDIFDSVAEGKLGAEQAKGKMKEAFSKIVGDVEKQVKDHKSAVKTAETIYNDAKINAARNIQKTAENQAKSIFEAKGAIEEKAVTLSADAMDELIRSNETVALDSLFDKFTKTIDEWRAKKSDILGPAADILEARLNSILEAYGAVPSAENAKKVLQGLGKDGWFRGPLQSAEQYEAAMFYRQAYRAFSDELKGKFPAYKALVEPAADLINLGKFLDDFGYTTEGNIRSRLIQLGAKKGPTFADEKALLDALGKKAEVPFMELVNPWLELGSKPEFTKSPEYQRWINSIQTLAKFEDERVKLALDKLMENTENARAWEAAIRDLKLDPEVVQALKGMLDQTAFFPIKEEHAAANARLADAIAQKSEIAGLSPRNVQAFLERVMKGKDIKSVELAKFLPQMNEKDISELLELVRLKENFEKGFMNGSRNVNAWRELFSTFLGAKIGGSVGAVVGMTIDRVGPAIAKSILDGYISAFGDLASSTGAKNPSALRVALYKFLSSGAPVNVEGFKSSVKYMEKALEGYNKLYQRIKNMYAAPLKMAVIEAKTEDNRRDAFLKKLQAVTPDSLLQADNLLGTYMPDHGASLIQHMTRMGDYLKSVFPSQMPQVIIDEKPAMSKMDKMSWNRTVDIARDPAVVLDHIERGTLTKRDIQDVSIMFPAWTQQAQKALMDKWLELKAKKIELPLKQKLALGQFLGIMVDPSLKPQSVLSAQGAAIQSQMQQMGKAPLGAMKALGKLPEAYQTQGQKAEIH